jgi:hypothetical protein
MAQLLQFSPTLFEAFHASENLTKGLEPLVFQVVVSLPLHLDKHVHIIKPLDEN